MGNTAMMANAAQAFMESMTPKFAVSYLRVSTRGQAERGGGHDEGFSIPAQREANKNKAKSLGAMVGKEFVDRGASAKSADRPQLQAMLEYVRENAERVDYVIVHKVDRLARNREDDAEIMKVLRECGVNTRSTARMPSKPIPAKTLFKVLANPYYKGIVSYQGVEYPGAHEPLVDEATWDKIQIILASRVNGERSNKHPHFLKGTVYCAYCGSRMYVSNERSKTGTIYPYFVCSGRHSKRHKDCKTKYVLIGEVERKIEQLYENIQLPHEVRVAVEEELQAVIAKEKEKYDVEMDGLLGQKRTLEHKSEKLLEAHYSDAIPLELLKKEQAKITKELAAINHEIKQHNITFEQISQNLTDSLDLLDDCAAFYKGASDTIKRLMNQAIFEKIYISCNNEIPLEIEEEYKPPFNSIIAPVKEDLTKLNRSLKLNTGAALAKIATAKNRILKQFRCGLSSCNDYTDIESYSNPKNFRDIFSSKGLLVEVRGMTGAEPLSENPSTQLSTSVVCLL